MPQQSQPQLQPQQQPFQMFNPMAANGQMPPNNMFDPVVASMAMNYGSAIADRGTKYVAQNVRRKKIYEYFQKFKF